MTDIFLSYASEDIERIRLIVKEFEKLGWSVFWDKKIPPGHKWETSIGIALEESRCVIAVWSEFAVKSDWVKDEATVAKKRGVLVPVVFDAVEPPMGFRQIQAADLSDWKNNSSEPEFQKLVNEVMSKISSPIIQGENSVGSLLDDRVSSPILTRNDEQTIIDNQNDRTEVIDAMNTVFEVLKRYIPEYEKMHANIKDRVLNDVKDENIFRCHQSRAFVLGRTNAGKTTLVNLMLDKNIFPTSQELSCTKTIACGSHKNGLIFYDSPGIGDIPKQENITRAALNLEQLQYDPVDEITLIDISDKKNEGPNIIDDEVKLDEIAGEINSDYFLKNSENIVLKKFKVDNFQQWSRDKFNFIIFVINTEQRMYWPDGALLTELYKNQKEKSAIFKIINIHSTEEKTLEYFRNDQNIIKIIEEANNRIKSDNKDKWLMVDAKHGVGVDEMIRAFCERLPVDVIKQFSEIVNVKYSDIIHKKLLLIYFDCVARIASLVGCYKVNYKVDGENLLSYSMNSLLVIVSYLFENSIDNFPKNAIKTLILELKKERYTWKEITTTVDVPEIKSVKVKKSSGNKVVDWVKDTVGIDSYQLQEVVENVSKEITDDKWYYQHGGVKAIEFTIAFGKTLTDFLACNRTITDEEFVKKMNSNSVQLNERKKIKKLLKGIRDCNKKYKTRIAAEVYDIIRYELVV